MTVNRKKVTKTFGQWSNFIRQRLIDMQVEMDSFKLKVMMVLTHRDPTKNVVELYHGGQYKEYSLPHAITVEDATKYFEKYPHELHNKSRIVRYNSRRQKE
jgi:hypothetical protein